jgi:hypothetical protein
MKNLNLKTTKTLIYIIAILLLFGACKPEPIESNPTITYHRLKTEQLNKTPYFTNPDFDTLTYLSNKGDTLIFAKLKTDTTWYYIRTQGAPGVTLNEDYYQTLRNTYQTIKGNGKFEVRHAKLSESGYNDNILITFNNEIYHINDNWYSKSFGYKYSLPFVDVNSTIYNNVIYVFSKLGDTTTNRMYLTIEDGCFYVKNKQSNDFWFLKN